ncbi:MAG: hypothetical protein IJV58_07680 [Oscillospiraceae bacterium]|nr:hypothetical protein [Oscillospiraceae bacterium]
MKKDHTLKAKWEEEKPGDEPENVPDQPAKTQAETPSAAPQQAVQQTQPQLPEFAPKAKEESIRATGDDGYGTMWLLLLIAAAGGFAVWIRFFGRDVRRCTRTGKRL